MTFEVTGVPGFRDRLERVERIHAGHGTHIRTQVSVVGRGHMSLWTNLDTWHSNPSWDVGTCHY